MKKEDIKTEEVVVDEANQYLEALKRERADFLNYKKEEGKRVSAVISLANVEIIKEVVARLDELDMAIEHAPPEVQSSDWFSGLKAVNKNFQDLLNQFGAERIETNTFNPEMHEAIEVREGEEDKIEEIKAGWRIGNRVIRPALVRVINKK